mmetsp:Transcript_33833/g.66790  ORF Transcript_33833/g.66790 Transcript_33833/m.66790 type:complete len:208 (+) Transcript_33833:606-1229(+)
MIINLRYGMRTKYIDFSSIFVDSNINYSLVNGTILHCTIITEPSKVMFLNRELGINRQTRPKRSPIVVDVMTVSGVSHAITDSIGEEPSLLKHDDVVSVAGRTAEPMRYSAGTCFESFDIWGQEDQIQVIGHNAKRKPVISVRITTRIHATFDEGVAFVTFVEPLVVPTHLVAEWIPNAAPVLALAVFRALFSVWEEDFFELTTTQM